MRHVDLCSGIGGFALGFEWAGLSKPVLFCDIEPWSRKVLAKHWPDVPIATDVKELADDPDRFIPRTDPRNTILSSGYPCQPFSQAGARRGTSDPRHIYPYISEIIAHKRPAWVVLENVYGHLSLGLDEVLNDLANQDYAARPFIFPSGAIVGAPHHRKRVWIIARNVGNAAHNGCSGWGRADGREGQTHQLQQQSGVWCEPVRPSEDVADTSGKQNYEQRRVGEQQWAALGRSVQAPQQEKWQASANSTDRCGEDVADTDNEGSQGEVRGWQTGTQRTPSGHLAKCDSNVADTTSQRQQRQGSSRDASNSTQRGEGQATEFINSGFGDKRQLESRICHLVDGLPTRMDRFDGWEREPADIPRVATGVKDRVSRLKGLGNAIVPQIAMQIGLTIKAVRDE